jgi:hypothetical protein
MTDCPTYRRALLADPGDPSPALAEHLAGCGACAAWTAAARRFESRLGRALRSPPGATAIDLSAGSRAPASLHGAALPGTSALREGRPEVAPRTGWRRRGLRLTGGWLAAAASVLLVLALSTSLWLAAPHASLAADVVHHMAGEPQAWSRTDVPVAPTRLAAILRAAGAELAPGGPMVSYAQSCAFRGHVVPHLVVQTSHGPVTVMLLVHESVAKPVRFDEGGYRGVLEPDDGHGSLAVLVRDQDANAIAVREIAAQVRGALRWR